MNYGALLRWLGCSVLALSACVTIRAGGDVVLREPAAVLQAAEPGFREIAGRAADAFAQRPRSPVASLSDGDVIETVLFAKRFLGECVALQRAEQPGRWGKLVLTWTIDRDGAVTSVGTVSEDLLDAPISRCVSAVVTSLRFPANAAPCPPVAFPFKF